MQFTGMYLEPTIHGFWVPAIPAGTTSFLAPGINEQTAIATILSDMDAEITALETRLAKTRSLKQGMMHELLTGKTRLI